MSGLRGSAHHTLATPPRLTVKPITLALAALLVTAILAVAIVLATNYEYYPAGATNAVPGTASEPTAGDIQRSQPPGVNGPGAHP